MPLDLRTEQILQTYFRELAEETRASARSVDDPNKRRVFQWLCTHYLALAQRAA